MEPSNILININGCKKLIVCFGGMAGRFGGIPVFEFSNYLSKTFNEECDIIYIKDKYQCWYQKGIDSLTNTIEETVLYLNNTVENTQIYENILIKKQIIF